MEKPKIIERLPALLLILLFFIAIYILLLGVMPLISQDETRYTEVAREMIVSGNWVVPHFNGMVYFEKPPLCYWMSALCQLVFGHNNFAARFPSALCTGLSAFFIFFFMEKYSKNRNIALLSSLIFLTCGLVLAIGTFSVFDAQFSFFVAAAMLSFFAAYKADRPSSQFLLLALCGVFAGLGFLIKGILMFVILAISIAPFLIWEKKWIKLFTMPWIPLIMAIVVVLPWGILISSQAPDFWNYFLIVQNFDRFFHAEQNRILHPQPFWFYLPIIFVGALPCFLHLPAIVKGLKSKAIFSDSVIRYCSTWLIFPLLFFSVSSGKLATYVLVCFPAVAILAAYGLYGGIQNPRYTKIFNITNKVFAYIFLAAAALSVVYVVISEFFKVPKLWSVSQLLVAIVSLGLFAVLLIYSARADKPFKKLMLFFLAPLFVMTVRPYLAPEFALQKQAFGDFILEQSNHITRNTKVVAYQPAVGAVCWYLERTDVYIYSKKGDFDYPLSLPENKDRFIPYENAKEFVLANDTAPGGVGFFNRTKYRANLAVKPEFEAIGSEIMFAKFDSSSVPIEDNNLEQ